MTRASFFRCLLVGAFFVGCSSENSTPESSRDSADVVGGHAETGYPAVGYLFSGTAGNHAECGATLIGPRVAVTAAHCVGSSTGYGIGFGVLNEAVRVRARSAYRHPGWNTVNDNRATVHDVAVLFLTESVTSVTPAVLARGNSSMRGRYIGYGRETAGNHNEVSGYNDSRKSAAQKIDEVGTRHIVTTGIDGGLCWGDSGGPLMLDGTNHILGVLSYFDLGQGAPSCNVGNTMGFTSLAAHEAWLQRAIACSGEPNPAQCMSEHEDSCMFDCAYHDYAPGECRPNGKWISYTCDGRCIKQTVSCDDPTCKYPCAAEGYAEGECRVISSREAYRCERGCISAVSGCF